MPVTHHIETRDERHERSGLEFQNRGDESQNLGVEFRAFARATANHALRPCVLSKRYNAPYRAKQIYQSRYIIRPHVKDRPGPFSIEELRTRTPAFPATVHEECGT